MFVLVVPDRRVGLRPVRSPELRIEERRSTSDQNCSAASRSRPSWRYTRTRSRDSSIAKNRRSHAQKNAIISGFVFAKQLLPLRALPRVERGAGGEEGVVGERADALDAEAIAFLDLGELGEVLGMRAAVRPTAVARAARTRRRAPRRDTDDFETPSSVAMSSKRRAGRRAAHARLLL